MNCSTLKKMPLLPLFFFCCFFLIPHQLFSASITYQEDSTTDFKNPERGYRNGAQDNNPISTIDRVYFEIGNYRSVDILPKTVFDEFNATCAMYRSKGMKIIPRYRYLVGNGTDAPLERILKHIEQLGPVLAANSDVVAHYQAGFIGCWGEWHHACGTDVNNLDNTEARRAILFKLLEVLPKDRMVVLRYNLYKREIFGTKLPLEADSAFSGSFRARVGFINDCFRASEDDRGTYKNSKEDSYEFQKTYLSMENRYVVQEGETCGPSEYSGCDSSMKDLKRMHFDGLNCKHLSSEWDKCQSTINTHFGYRIVLKNALLQDSVRPGSNFIASINLKNVGWGKIYNPRGCELVFRNIADKNKIVVKLGNDPRRWCMREDTLVNVPISASLPANMPEGTYQVYLNLPDPYPSLHGRKEYSIRLANIGVWEDTTGYNSLLHNVVVSMQASVGNRMQETPALKGIGAVRVKKQNGSIEFTLPGNAMAPIALEILTLSGGKVWSRTVIPGENGGTVKWTPYSSRVYLLRLSVSEKRPSHASSGIIRTLIF